MTPRPPEMPAIRRVRNERDALALFATIAASPLEMCAFAYLDPQWRLLGMRHCPSGWHDMAIVPFRSVVRDALALDATLVVMAHNHPSGDARPSRDDLHATRRLAHLLNAVGVRLADHLIVTASGGASISSAALL